MIAILTDLIADLKRKTQLQPVPMAFEDEEYGLMIFDGFAQLYTDLGYAGFEQYVDKANSYLSPDRDYSQSELEYVLNCAVINFYQVVQQEVNSIVGYSTDALSVTNADKPYANIASEISKLVNRNITLFYKIDAEGKA